VDTTDLKQYISKIHELYPLLTIGIFIRASEIQDYYKQDCPLLKCKRLFNIYYVLSLYLTGSPGGGEMVQMHDLRILIILIFQIKYKNINI